MGYHLLHLSGGSALRTLLILLLLASPVFADNNNVNWVMEVD